MDHCLIFIGQSDYILMAQWKVNSTNFAPLKCKSMPIFNKKNVNHPEKYLVPIYIKLANLHVSPCISELTFVRGPFLYSPITFSGIVELMSKFSGF